MYEQYTLSKTKIALCVIVLSVALIGYDQFSHKASAQDIQAPAANTESLSLVNKIESIKLDTSIIKGAVFNSLEDFSEEIKPEPIGRLNPFAPINGVSPRTSTGR